MQHAKKENEVSPVFQIILSTLARHRLLALGILLSICGAILTALVPPLVLARIIDTLTLGTLPPLFLVLFYFIIAGPDRTSGICKRGPSDRLWPENYPRASQPPDG